MSAEDNQNDIVYCNEINGIGSAPLMENYFCFLTFKFRSTFIPFSMFLLINIHILFSSFNYVLVEPISENKCMNKKFRSTAFTFQKI